MKKTSLIITALMLVVGCSKEPINIDELVKKGDIFYTKDTNKPYSGPVFSLYKNGQKGYEGIFKDGEQDGKWTSWWRNGQKGAEETYKGVDEIGHPLQQGKWTEWYENGQKNVEGTYKDGEEIGSTRWEYYSNGQKKSETTYKDGKFFKETIWD